MKNLYYRIIDLKPDGIYTYNVNKDRWEKDYKSGLPHTLKDYFIALAIRNELKKRLPQNDIYVDSFSYDMI